MPQLEQIVKYPVSAQGREPPITAHNLNARLRVEREAGKTMKEMESSPIGKGGDTKSE